MIIANDDKRLQWNGVVSLQRTDGWVRPWRLPYDALDLYAPGDSPLRDRAACPAGVRLCLRTDAESLVLRCAPMPEAGNMDLYADGELVETLGFAAGDGEVACKALPAGEKHVEIWFSQTVPFGLGHLEVPDGAWVEQSRDRRPRWVTYGSSISHCGAASSPSFTWPGVVARKMGFNLTSLGFGGQCHADPMLARLIRDTPADFVSLKLGINIYGGGTLNPRSFRPAVIGSIATVRDGHPHIPLVVCSPIWSPPREKEKNAVGFTLEEMRHEVEEAVKAFRAHGDTAVHYVDGRRLFDHTLVEHLPDDLHPSAEGYRLMGENFARVVFDEIGVEVKAL